MVNREQLLAESRHEIYDSLPKIAVGLAIAFLIWIFGVLIFLPLAKVLGNPFLFGLIGLDSLISAIILVALVIVVFGIFREVLDVTDALAGYVTGAYSRGETPDEQVERYRLAFRGIAYVLLAVIAFLFFLPFIAGIFPVLAGIILVILVLWAILVLFRTGRLFSGEIERWAAEFSQKIELQRQDMALKEQLAEDRNE
ncbi:hypothetical protein [Methanoculleus sp. UBA303]|uniref:hypothetical protein n=1 Tax=Methanoculleus sp. UBA303 TaxID=1915497 RepID=UPI0025FD3D1C|nr:hypothetical protein [Methanoculleus sp. UBA303]